MYVSELTRDMGAPGEQALAELFSRAERVGAIGKAPPIELVR
jgi:predicted solute-binding protein